MTQYCIHCGDYMTDREDGYCSDQCRDECRETCDQDEMER